MTKIIVTAEAIDGEADGQVKIDSYGHPLEVYGLLGATMSGVLVRTIKALEKVPVIGSLPYHIILESFCRELYKRTLRDLGVEGPAENTIDKYMKMGDISEISAKVIGNMEKEEKL